MKKVKKSGQKPAVTDWLTAIGNLLVGLAAIGTLLYLILSK
jgi:hypothetical protein